MCITWPLGPKSLTHIKPYQWRSSALLSLRLLPLIGLKCATVDKSKRIRPQRVVTYTRSRAHTHCLLPPKRGVLLYNLSSTAVQQGEAARDLTPLPRRSDPLVAPTNTGWTESPSCSLTRCSRNVLSDGVYSNPTHLNFALKDVYLHILALSKEKSL